MNVNGLYICICSTEQKLKTVAHSAACIASWKADKLAWRRDGALYAAKGAKSQYEVSPHRGYDRMKGGDYAEWELREDGEWVETFALLRDAKARAEWLERTKEAR